MILSCLLEDLASSHTITVTIATAAPAKLQTLDLGLASSLRASRSMSMCILNFNGVTGL